MTFIIQIGNSDNKLSRLGWSKFIDDTDQVVSTHSKQIHFRGGSNFDSKFENACWIFEPYGSYEDLVTKLACLRDKYGQNSIALTIGETKFI